MSVTIQVRDLDSEVQQILRDAAKQEGLSLSALLRRELTRTAAQIEARGKLDDLGRRNTLGMPVGYIPTDELVAMIREDRGE